LEQTNGNGMVIAPMKIREKLGYGIGDLGYALIWQMISLYLLFFYTDVFGISAGQAGIIFLIARAWDAVNDPLLGFIADRTQTRWGKFRPYLLFGAVPAGICLVLVFTTPNLGNTGKFVWALVTYMILGMVYTAVNLPYGSLLAVCTRDQGDRSSLAAYRMIFGFLGVMVVGILTKPLVGRFPNEQIGFQAVSAIYAIVAVIIIWVVFASVKEKVKPEEAKKYSLKETFKILAINKPLLLICSAVLFVTTAITIRSAVGMYFFKYNLAREDLFPVFMAILVVSMILGCIVANSARKKFEKKSLYLIGMIIFAIGDIGIFFSPYSAIKLIIFFTVLAGLGTGIFYVLLLAMVADTVEYAEWKTGKRAEGITYSLYTFMAKLSAALGGAGAGAILSLSGYVPNSVQTASVDFSIRALFTLGPFVSGVIAVIIMNYYPLDSKLFAQIVKDLENRNAESK